MPWRSVCVVLEQLSLTMQMRSVAAAGVLVGVHGQALVWMPFMLSDRPRAAVVEVVMPERAVPKGKRRSVSNPSMYGDIAKALGIRHQRVHGTIANISACDRDHPLACNLTVSVPALIRGVNRSAAYVRG